MAHEKQFIAWLQADLTHFLALVEEGSAAAGDPWQHGFSDHDLTLVVRQDLASERQAVHDFLSKHPLGNECLVHVCLASDFAKGDSLNDVSLKFRAKTIAGSDVVAAKAAPERRKALKIGKDGLRALTGRLERRWTNLPSWTTEYAQHKNYEIFKNFFVYYGALHYGRTGSYPTTRAEAAATFKETVPAGKLLGVTNAIGSADKKAQKAAIEAALELIPKILS